MPEHHFLAPGDIQRDCHIVLVEPRDSLNIGSVARAMMNLGFSNLRIVAPLAFDVERACITGRTAKDLIQSAIHYPSLTDALSDMEDVVGFSSYQGDHRGGQLMLPEWSAKLKEVSAGRKVALLFGPEDTGLMERHTEHCRYLVRIPTTKAYPSMNLAQAAMVVMYELSRLSWGAHDSQPEVPRPGWNEYLQLDRISDEVLSMCGFFRDGSPASSPGLVKNLFRRMDMSKREMGILLALFNRVRIALSRQGGTSP